jgi:hypothetical protein
MILQEIINDAGGFEELYFNVWGSSSGHIPLDPNTGNNLFILLELAESQPFRRYNDGQITINYHYIGGQQYDPILLKHTTDGFNDTFAFTTTKALSSET